ncbi:SulP family inorganic anion transporter [Pelagicoccus sp. SDUM812002]|uniref:SulP family inorganic anion transporter n=1 Tax=Pelagicoccus sp. SDUM812002 TaxID=3041266 RepID=UPI00280FD8B0|nr:SulP family inorganic anion transporter [Pelagicoccus sp. SDUM812002]MDQ8186523.1 SulP family inorganic anion transporter [Pelagicoccus sp. SDUM812002]
MLDSSPSDETQSKPAKKRRIGIDLFPLRKTAAGYNGKAFSGDFRAALNVALLAFPQGMAYAAIAGLPLRYGIFGSVVATIIGAFFAGSKYITLGPTNATSVMVLSSFTVLGIVSEQEAVSNLPLLVLLVGIVLVIGSLLRVASLIQYVSRTVITGYITAAASLIIANQLRKTLGFDFTAEEKAEASTFFQVVDLTIRHLSEVQWATFGLSVATAAIFIVLERFVKRLPSVAVTLVLSSLLAYLCTRYIPNFSVALLPGLNASEWGLTFPANLSQESINLMLSPAIAIALLCTLEGNSIGKSLAAREGARLNSNQEMFSVGMANIGCALFSGMAASGSLTRSQLNVGSGAFTPLSGLYSGIIMFASAFVLAGFVQYVPTAALAVVVISIGISLLNKHQLKIVTKSTRSDSITFYVTFLTGLLFALDFAIYIGTCVSIALFLKKVASPEIVEVAINDETGQIGHLSNKEQRSDPEVSIVHVEGELFFGASELFRDQMRRVADDVNLKVVVMKLRNAHNLDATSCMALEELIKYMNERDRILLVSEVRPDTMRIFENSGIIKVINPINLFADEDSNPTLSTAKALKRARQILGGRTPKVSIYAKEKRP